MLALVVSLQVLSGHRTTPHFAAWRRAADEHVMPGSQVNTFADRLHPARQDRP